MLGPNMQSPQQNECSVRVGAFLLTLSSVTNSTCQFCDGPEDPMNFRNRILEDSVGLLQCEGQENLTLQTPLFS